MIDLRLDTNNKKRPIQKFFLKSACVHISVNMIDDA